MILSVALVIDSYFRLRRWIADGTWPTIESILTDLGDRWGYGLLFGAFSLAGWISYKKYNKWAGLESEDEE